MKSFLFQDPLTSITVPRSVIHPPALPSNSDDDENVTTTTPTPDNRRLSFQFIWYSNAKLFPLTTRNHDDPVLRGKSWNVVSAVLSVSLCKC